MSTSSDSKLDTCGCCETEPPETPVSNPPGQPALRYRIDTQPTFLRRMLNALPHQTVPPGIPEEGARRPLAALTARSLDDPTIALLDAWATVADVLTFYQERIANEGFLRTSTERRSVLELAREIGYELNPGVAAGTDLAFTVEDAVGAPAQATVPIGTKVLSVPGAGQKSQPFETMEAIVARPQWNKFPPRTGDPEQVLPGMTDLFLAGTASQLQVGDSLLFVGDSRLSSAGDLNWDVRVIRTIEPDPKNGRTRVTWKGGLNTGLSFSANQAPAVVPARVYVFRKRAALFGHNAPEFRILPPDTQASFAASGTPVDWTDVPDVGFNLEAGSVEIDQSVLDLDINDPKILPGSWIALAAESPAADPNHTILSTTDSVPSNPPTESAFPLPGLLPAPFPLSLGEEVPPPEIVQPEKGIEAALFHVDDGSPAMITNRTGFALSSTVTRVKVDGINVLVGLPRRRLQFLVESELLALGIRPVTVPVDGLEQIPEIDVAPDSSQGTGTGNLLAVGLDVAGLKPLQKLALVGKRPNVRVVDANTLGLRTTAFLQGTAAASVSPVPFIAEVQDLLQPPGPDSSGDGGLKLDDPAGAREPLAGHTFELLAPLDPFGPTPPIVIGLSYSKDGVTIPLRTWRLRSRTGAVGTARLPFFAVDVIPAEPSGETIAEIRVIDTVFQGSSRMLLKLDRRLEFVYDRGSLTISANVAAATNGETVSSETLGSGSAVAPNQLFVLKRPPLTFVSSANSPTGAVSTLQIRVNGILWREVPALFGHAPDDQVYELRRTDDGQTNVIFGDGKNGSRLPTGVGNVIATYRSGIGPDGEVDAGSLTLLSTRPLGVRSVINPLRASGAAAPAQLEDARRDAPLTVRTLDRVVSVSDVEDFASSFAGVGKAQARLLWTGDVQLVHLTVGGADGQPIPTESPVLANLAGAILADADPSLLIQRPIDTFVPRSFRLDLQLAIDDRFEKPKVLDAVRGALLDAFSFAKRSFGQSVNEAEILAVAQNVPGVLAANVASLTDEQGNAADQLVAVEAHFDANAGRILPAELLTIDPDHLVLEDLVL